MDRASINIYIKNNVLVEKGTYPFQKALVGFERRVQG